MKSINSFEEIEPFEDKLLLEEIDMVSNEKFNNIFVSQLSENDDKLRFGKVLKVGGKVVNVKPNEYILFNKWSGAKLKLDSVYLVLVKESEVVAKVVLKTKD